MMRKDRNLSRASPLFALFAFEVVAILVLTMMGSMSSMHVPWGNLWSWLGSSTIDELALPLLRYAALGVAYWMLVSTVLFVLAQATQVPIAIRVASMFTLPAVRRAVDGAMAVSIVTTSIVGFAGIASAADNPTTGDSAASSLVTSAPNDTSAPSSTSTTTSTTAPAGDSTTSLAPGAGQDFVPTPKPGAPVSTTTTTPAPTTSTTQAPATPTPTPSTPSQNAPSPSTTVNASEHRVVPGDNLWTISRDALAASSNRQPGQVGEAEIRTYWLKVIDANRDSLRSHDPHWIFPGEVIKLPALDTASGS